MFRSCSVLPLILFPLATSLLSAQASVQEVATISPQAFLGAKVTAYGGYVWPNLKGSLKVETNFLTSPAVEATAYTTRPTSLSGHGSIPSCQTRIRMNGTTRDSASRLGITLVGAPVFSCSLSSLAMVTNVLAGAGAQRTLTFGSAQISLATNYSASASCSANFVLGSVHEMDNAVMQVWAQGATTVVASGGLAGVGILSQLNYGTHTARIDDAEHGPVVSKGTLSWTYGAANLLEVLFVPGFSPQTVDTHFTARSGNRTWYQYFEG